MQYTEKELAKLIQDVEQQFTAHLNKSEAGAAPSAVLAKAEDKKEDEKEEKEEKPKEKSDAPKAEEKHSEEAPKSEEKHDEEAPKAEEKHDEPKAEHESKEGEEESHGYDDEDMEHMHKMYMSMNKAELKAHHDAVRKSLDSQGMAKCGEEAPAAAPMAKSETITVPETVVSKETELVKAELADTKAKFEDLQKNFAAVSEFLQKLVKKTAPQGKAITSMDVIAKSETTVEEKPLTKGEITAILIKKTQDPSLSKSDREAINNYYLNSGSTTQISHLLKSSVSK